MYFILSWKCCQLEGIFLLGYSIRWWIIGIKKWPLYVQESHTWFSCSIKRIFSSGNIEIRLCFVLPITSWGYGLCFLLVGRWILYPCPCERICLTFGADEYSLCVLIRSAGQQRSICRRSCRSAGKRAAKNAFYSRAYCPKWDTRWNGGLIDGQLLPWKLLISLKFILFFVFFILELLWVSWFRLPESSGYEQRQQIFPPIVFLLKNLNLVETGESWRHPGTMVFGGGTSLFIGRV